MILVTLSGKIRIVATTKGRILRGTRSKTSPFAIEDRNSYARRPKIYSGYDGHWSLAGTYPNVPMTRTRMPSF